MPAGNHVIGLDIGGTKTAVVLGDCAGDVYDRCEFPTCPQRGFQATFGQLCECIQTVRDRATRDGRRPTAISVSIGGPLDIARGIVRSPPNLPGWDDIPLKSLLEERFGLPVHVEHDGNAGALAEWYFGAGRGCRNMVFLTMGTGIGGGLILNGQLYRGTTDLAGEVGHVRIAETGPKAYGKAGSWEAFCGGAGITRLAAHLFPQRWTDEQVAVRELAELAKAGDRDAQAVLTEVGHRLGRGLAILLDTLNPQIIVIGSLAVHLGDLILRPAEEEMRREALPGTVVACRVVPAALGQRLGDVAALCAAIAASGGPTRRPSHASG
jgi:glucokinase